MRVQIALSVISVAAFLSGGVFAPDASAAPADNRKLAYAIQKGDAKLAEAAIVAGADVNQPDEGISWQLPLALALGQPKISEVVIGVLLDHGADPQAWLNQNVYYDSKNSSVFTRAMIKKASPAVIARMISKGVKAETRGFNFLAARASDSQYHYVDLTHLESAILLKDWKTATLLIKNGVQWENHPALFHWISASYTYVPMPAPTKLTEEDRVEMATWALSRGAATILMASAPFTEFGNPVAAAFARGLGKLARVFIPYAGKLTEEMISVRELLASPYNPPVELAIANGYPGEALLTRLAEGGSGHYFSCVPYKDALPSDGAALRTVRLVELAVRGGAKLDAARFNKVFTELMQGSCFYNMHVHKSPYDDQVTEYEARPLNLEAFHRLMALAKAHGISAVQIIGHGSPWNAFVATGAKMAERKREYDEDQSSEKKPEFYFTEPEEFLKAAVENGLQDLDQVRDDYYSLSLLAHVTQGGLGATFRVLEEGGCYTSNPDFLAVWKDSYGSSRTSKIVKRIKVDYDHLLKMYRGDVNVVLPNGNTLFAEAVCAGDGEAVRALLDRGAQINQEGYEFTNPYGSSSSYPPVSHKKKLTTLEIANECFQFGNHGGLALDILFEKGVAVANSTVATQTFGNAVLGGAAKAIEGLLDRHGVVIPEFSAPAKDAVSHLNQAVSHFRLDAARVLLARMKNKDAIGWIDYKSDHYGEAQWYGNAFGAWVLSNKKASELWQEQGLAKELAAGGASARARVYSIRGGVTSWFEPLHLVKSEDQMEPLILAGADINAADFEAETPLVRIIRNNRREVQQQLAKALIERFGADCSRSKSHPFDVALEMGATELAGYLDKHCAKPR